MGAGGDVKTDRENAESKALEENRTKKIKKAVRSRARILIHVH